MHFGHVLSYQQRNLYSRGSLYQETCPPRISSLQGARKTKCHGDSETKPELGTSTTRSYLEPTFFYENALHARGEDIAQGNRRVLPDNDELLRDRRRHATPYRRVNSLR